jgi:hypothetical protein
VTNQTSGYVHRDERRGVAGFTGAWSRLGIGTKIAVGCAAALLPCCGGLVALGALTDGPAPPRISAADGAQVDPTAAAAGDVSVQGDGSATANSRPSPTATARGKPPGRDPVSGATGSTGSTRTRVVEERQPISYRTRTVDDPSAAKGVRAVRTRGVAGSKTLTYEVTEVDGRRTAKKLLRTTVTKRPVTKVVAVGTRAQSRCDPNYSGCVPIASDVDCAGGSGNGPAYVSGVVKVIGDDVYDLDRDSDGYGCN